MLRTVLSSHGSVISLSPTKAWLMGRSAGGRGLGCVAGAPWNRTLGKRFPGRGTSDWCFGVAFAFNITQNLETSNAACSGLLYYSIPWRS